MPSPFRALPVLIELQRLSLDGNGDNYRISLIICLERLAMDIVLEELLWGLGVDC